VIHWDITEPRPRAHQTAHHLRCATTDRSCTRVPDGFVGKLQRTDTNRLRPEQVQRCHDGNGGILIAKHKHVYEICSQADLAYLLDFVDLETCLRHVTTSLVFEK